MINHDMYRFKFEVYIKNTAEYKQHTDNILNSIILIFHYESNFELQEEEEILNPFRHVSII